MDVRLDSLVAFDHVAAGHDGIMTDATGALVYKPCTNAEIAFYEETINHHADFAELMPTFIGTLQHGQSEQLKETLHGVATDSTDSQHTDGTAMGAMVLPAEELENGAGDGSAAGPAPVPHDNATMRGKKLETEFVIVLENVLANFKRPNLMDIKLGKRLWADDAPQAKRARLDEVALNTTTGSLGFRIAGMRIWEAADPGKDKTPASSRGEQDAGSYKFYDKTYGRGLTEPNVDEAFRKLLCVDHDEQVKDLAEDIIRDIDESVGEIEQVLAAKESRMYSTSILLVFEGDREARKEVMEEAMQRASTGGDDKEARRSEAEEADEEEEESDEEGEKEKKLFDVKVIDFAHAAWVPGQGPDENFLFGVRNVRRVLKSLVVAEERK